MPSEVWTLGFDTSAAHCAAALLRGSDVVIERYEEMSKGQAERLMPMLEGLLSDAGIGWRDLSVIGVGIGPGNFTGVRISVAGARGLALSLQIPAIGVSTLEALAHAQSRPIWVIEDARRNEAYVQHFGASDAAAPALMACTDIAVRDGDRLTGSAAASVKDASGKGVVCPQVLPLAVAIAQIAQARAVTGKVWPRPAPLYLRGADAAPPADPPPKVID